MKRLFFGITLATTLIIPTFTYAASDKESAQSAAASSKDSHDLVIRRKIAGKVPPARVEDVRPVAGGALYEIALNNRLLYATADGKYLLTGDLFDLETRSNLSEPTRAGDRKTELSNIKDSDAIIFEPSGPTKETITVFTDPDCTYCRKFHSEIAEVNRLGIRVRYVAFPRTGPNTDSWRKAEAIWCSKDRRHALTEAKLGHEVVAEKCAAPIAGQFAIGEHLGTRGTPMILSEDAHIVGGYLPPDQLAARLDTLKKQPAMTDIRPDANQSH